MLRANSMPCTDDAAFQKRERGLDAVGVNVRSESDVFFSPVIDGFMPIAKFAKRTRISRQFISHDYVYVLRDIVLNIFCQRANFRILSMKESQIAVALADADNDLFHLFLLFLSDATCSAADVGFIHLDRSIEHWLAGFCHRSADSVTEIPRGFVRAFVQTKQRALQLICAHALLGLAEQQDGEKPRFQRQMRVMKDSLRRNAKLVAALFAFKLFLAGNLKNVLALAADAFDAEGPAQFFEQHAACFVRGVQSSEVCESHG